MYYFFRLGFWIYDRWTYSFWLPELPPDKVIRSLAEIFATKAIEETPELKGRIFTSYELMPDKFAKIPKLSPEIFSSPNLETRKNTINNVQMTFFDIK